MNHEGMAWKCSLTRVAPFYSVCAMRWLALWCSVSVGCSFVFVEAPPPQHQKMPVFDCTDSRVVPILDTLWTALQTGNLVLAATVSDQKWEDQFKGDPPFSRHAAIGVYAVFAALGAAGMVHGFTTVEKCRDAKTELILRVMPQPGSWPPPPAPVLPPSSAPLR